MLRKLTTAELARPSAQSAKVGHRHAVVAVLDNIRSAHNVGAILRTADALALAHVFLCGITPPGDHIAVFKTALGADASVPWSHAASAREVVEQFRRKGMTVAALELTASPTPVETLTASHFPLALVVGNEVDGVDAGVLAVCDLAIELPQWGAKHSLNASVAFGVAAYDLVRRARALGVPSGSALPWLGPSAAP